MVSNFLLRENHVEWDKMHQENEEKVQKEWLEELGYDTKLWQVDFTTHRVKRNELKLMMNDAVESETPDEI